MECTNYMDVSDSFRYTPFVKGWGLKQSKIDELDITIDSEIDDMIKMTEDLPGVNVKFKQ